MKDEAAVRGAVTGRAKVVMMAQEYNVICAAISNKVFLLRRAMDVSSVAI